MLLAWLSKYSDTYIKVISDFLTTCILNKLYMPLLYFKTIFISTATTTNNNTTITTTNSNNTVKLPTSRHH